MWMNSNEIMMGEGVSGSTPLPSDMMMLDQTAQLDTGSYFPLPPPPYESPSQHSLEMDGFLMMEDYDGDYCEEPPRYMTAATQTIPGLRKIRKIMPFNHPGLKLQTPIAYKCDTDPSVIPIKKDGMAVCVKCGAIGVKHAFYTRNRNFCSLTCARGNLEKCEKEEVDNAEDVNIHIKYPNNSDVRDDELITREVIRLPDLGTDAPLPSYNLGPNVGTFPLANLELTEDPVPEPVQGARKYELSLSYNWKPKLNSDDFVAAPVDYFKHAPMSDCWEDVTVGMKVEVENSDVASADKIRGVDSFWVATVLRIAGYQALLRYEGFDEGQEFWVNLCSSNVHPVGWCAMRGKPLIPPKRISENCVDWKEFLVRRLTGARTLPTSFSLKVVESLRSRFRVGMQLEVIDPEKISQMCVATIKRIIGKRLHMTYFNSSPSDAGFWCHEDSPLIHPVGWSLRVGHGIDALRSYLERCESGVMDKDDASEELFTAPFQSVSDWKNHEGFKLGMKLEAIDPLNLSAICAASVMKVLKDGYLMIRIDSYSEGGDGSDWFCYHSASPCIFPPGFCHENGIPLVPPINYSPDSFTWDELVRKTGCVLAPASLFHREEIDHGFIVGMSLECADIMDPRLVCVATVTQVVGRLLKIHFDGWEDDFDQWMDCRSPDIYPVGWCKVVSHKLEAPKNQLQPGETADKKKKHGKKTKKKQTKAKSSPPKKQISVVDSNEDDSLGTVKSETLSGDEKHTPKGTNRQIVSEKLELCLPKTTVPCQELRSIKQVEPEPEPKLLVSKQEKYIPRLADGIKDYQDLNPSIWTSEDVAQFLSVNDCGVYAENFRVQETCGKRLLSMTQDEIMKVTGKMGPALKIFATIQKLNHQLKLQATRLGRR